MDDQHLLIKEMFDENGNCKNKIINGLIYNYSKHHCDREEAKQHAILKVIQCILNFKPASCTFSDIRIHFYAKCEYKHIETSKRQLNNYIKKSLFDRQNLIKTVPLDDIENYCNDKCKNISEFQLFFKKEVYPNLPDKYKKFLKEELNGTCGMSRQQRYLYRKYIREFTAKIEQKE